MTQYIQVIPFDIIDKIIADRLGIEIVLITEEECFLVCTYYNNRRYIQQLKRASISQ